MLTASRTPGKRLRELVSRLQVENENIVIIKVYCSDHISQRDKILLAMSKQLRAVGVENLLFATSIDAVKFALLSALKEQERYREMNRLIAEGSIPKPAPTRRERR